MPDLRREGKTRRMSAPRRPGFVEIVTLVLASMCVGLVLGIALCERFGGR